MIFFRLNKGCVFCAPWLDLTNDEDTPFHWKKNTQKASADRIAVSFVMRKMHCQFVLSHAENLVILLMFIVIGIGGSTRFDSSDGRKDPNMGCPCGYYCPLPSPRKLKKPVICPIGSYCPQGPQSKTTGPSTCVPGNHCPTQGLCEPQGCPCGSYCPAGSSKPIACPAGTFCPVNSSTPIICTMRNQCLNASLCSPLQVSDGLNMCDPKCDPLNPPPGHFCSIDPIAGCGLFCYDPSLCKMDPISTFVAG